MTAGQRRKVSTASLTSCSEIPRLRLLDAPVIRIGTDRIGGSQIRGLAMIFFQGIHLGGINAPLSGD